MHIAQAKGGGSQLRQATDLTVRSCRELGDLLRRNVAVDLVTTQALLPDGDYVDILRLLAARSECAEVIVLQQDGTPILRFEIQGRSVQFERVADHGLSLGRAPHRWRASCRSDGRADGVVG